ncbi:MAG: hypothetical protein IJ679_00080, partial [Lachnospiraceae bacterium]|nr:hypothetical protein [Lachnospiraceae bacterium]
EGREELLELLGGGTHTSDAFAERLRRIQGDLYAVPEADRDNQAIVLTAALLKLFDEEEDDAFGKLTAFFLSISTNRQRELLSDHYDEWREMGHAPWGEQGRETSEEEVAFFNEKELNFAKIFGFFIERRGTHEEKVAYRVFTGEEQAGEAAEKLSALIDSKDEDSLNALFRLEGEGENQQQVMLSGVAELLLDANPFEGIQDEEIKYDPAFLKLLVAKRLLDDLVIQKKPTTFAQMAFVAKQLSEAVGACEEARLFLRPTVNDESRKLFVSLNGISESLMQLAEGNGSHVLELLYSLRRKQFVSSFGSMQELGKWTAAGGRIAGREEGENQGGGQNAARNRRLTRLPQDIRFRVDNLIAYQMALFGNERRSKRFALYTRSMTGMQLRYEEELKRLLLVESDTFDHFLGEVRALEGKLNEKTGAAKGAQETYALLIGMLGGEAHDPGTLARFILTLNNVHIRWLFGEAGFLEWERIHGHLEANEDELENEGGQQKSTEQKEVEFFKNNELNYRKLFRMYLSKQRQRGPHLIHYYRSLGVSIEIGG